MLLVINLVPLLLLVLLMLVRLVLLVLLFFSIGKYSNRSLMEVTCDHKRVVLSRLPISRKTVVLCRTDKDGHFGKLVKYQITILLKKQLRVS